MLTLFQKLVRLAPQRFGNANQAGQRKVIFGAFNAADECPVHIRTFGERFLRQGHFSPKRPHVFSHSLAILDVHAGQVWKKMAAENIDVRTIVFNTRQASLTLAGLNFGKFFKIRENRFVAHLFLVFRRKKIRTVSK
jgi:hypothetical protein